MERPVAGHNLRELNHADSANNRRRPRKSGNRANYCGKPNRPHIEQRLSLRRLVGLAPPVAHGRALPHHGQHTHSGRAGGTFPANSTFGSPYVAGGITGSRNSYPFQYVRRAGERHGILAQLYRRSQNGEAGLFDGLASGDRTQPNVSTLTSPDGSVLAAAAIVPAGTASSINASYLPDDTDLVVDINGYFAPPAAGTLQFYPLPPCRVLDTRPISNGGSFLPNSNLRVAPLSTA